MSFVTAEDGTRIFYKDWGSGRPVVFSHGWPLNADAWDYQLKLVADNGFRGIAHDRRGHGRSDQPWTGNDMDTYADDLAKVMDTLDLEDAVLVGHSTGGGEVARYIGRHGTRRLSKVVLLGAVPPIMVKSDTNPEGTPIEALDAIRAGVATNRSQFYKDLAESFFGFNRATASRSQGSVDAFWLMSMQVSLKGAYDCIEQFSETDFTADLESIDVPTFIAHGEDDQIVPIAASADKTVQIVKDSVRRTYPGAPHGLVGKYKEDFNADLLAFLNDELLQPA